MHPQVLKQLPKQKQNIKQMQHLMSTQEMQQALHFLELPIMELRSLIEAELEQNPILEEEETLESENEIVNDSIPTEEELNFHENDYQIMEQLDEEFKDHFLSSGTTEKKQTSEDEKLKNYLDSLICQKETLFQHLIKQSNQIFENANDLKMAEAIIGNFDRSGFLTTSLREIALLNGFEEKALEKILEQIKTLDPAGIGAKNIQESLLLQLKFLGKISSIAYQIIEHHYDDLLHHRLPAIKNGLQVKEEIIRKAIANDIAKLNLHPGLDFSDEVVQYIVPDITILEDQNELIIFVNEDPLPPLRLNRRYTQLLEDTSLCNETKEFVQKKIASAKWMLKNLTKRNETLVKIAHAVVNKQKSFLVEPKGLLTPMTMQEVAQEIGLHESTVARAVSNKYIDTPKGLKSLKSFFTNSYITDDGIDISSTTVKNEVYQIIQKENKKNPLSDEAISNLLKEKGIPCARRTVAKYRYQLNLGNAQQRKQSFLLKT